MAARSACRCGHPADMHEHYRPGTDCGECGPGGCPAYGPDLTRQQRINLTVLSPFAAGTPMAGEEADPPEEPA